MKTCKICKIEKPFESFTKGRGSCKPCRAQEQRLVVKNLPESKVQELRTKSSQWRKDNPDKVKEYQRRKYQTMKDNPETYNKHKLRTQVQHYFSSKSKTEKTEELLGYTLDVFYDYFEKEINSFVEKGEKYHIDHKIPLSWFKENTPISIIWDLRNLQITSANYNVSKCNKFMDEVPTDYLQEAVKYINHPMVEE